MSSNDMWQPEQPSSQTVARRGFAHFCSLPHEGEVGQELSPLLAISATDLPFSNRAPVGQTWTHLPQLVQVRTRPRAGPGR